MQANLSWFLTCQSAQQLTQYGNTAAATAAAAAVLTDADLFTSADLLRLLTWQCADELALLHEGGRLQGTIRCGPQHIPPAAAAAVGAALVVVTCNIKLSGCGQCVVLRQLQPALTGRPSCQNSDAATPCPKL
jgi:hypothetical protein